MMIYKETLTFLKNLKTHNDRVWFQDNKDKYNNAQKNVESFVQKVISEIHEFDKDIPPHLEAKKCMFRIYRDARFSLDKTPYKSWFGAAIGREGRKTPGPIYYYHLEPNKSFIGLGYWRPDKDHLKMIREEIDYNVETFKGILHSTIEKGWSDLDNSDKLKKAPKPYDAEHPGIEYLKNKSFILTIDLSDEKVLSENFLDFVVQKFKEGQEFTDFLKDALIGEADFTEGDLGNIF